MSKRKRTKDCDHHVQLGIDGWTESESESDAETDAAKGPLESTDVQDNALDQGRTD